MQQQMQPTDVFWVIFDTCTLLPYYADVHNLLALPPKNILRYEYRRKWISQSALDVIESSNYPQSVLLIYAQEKRYRRRDPTPPDDTPTANMIWIPTRLGEMVLVPPPEGDNVYFDIRVLGYPSLEDEEALNQILFPLQQAEEIPFRKWVAISSEAAALGRLQQGKDGAKWQAIIDRLGVRPSQFSGDSFWRLNLPVRNVTKEHLEPVDDVQERLNSRDEYEAYKVSSRYELVEGEEYAFGFVSHTPRQDDLRDNIREPTQRLLEVDVGAESALEALDKTFPIRQYTEEGIRIRAKRYEEFEDKDALIKFISKPKPSDWPVGPEFSLRVKVKRRAQVFLAAAVLLAIGAAAGIIANKSTTLAIQWRGVLAALSALCVVGALLLATRKLPLVR